jgi:hypothetical protein
VAGDERRGAHPLYADQLGNCSQALPFLTRSPGRHLFSGVLAPATTATDLDYANCNSTGLLSARRRSFARPPEGPPVASG